MTNAELFKKTFGIYSEEFWSYTEKQMLDWINADVPDKNVGDTISRRAALKALEFTWAGKAAFDAIKALPSVEQNRIARETAGKSPEEICDFLYWLMSVYGMQFTDTRAAVIEWLKEEEDG